MFSPDVDDSCSLFTYITASATKRITAMDARIAIFRSLESICYLYQIFSVIRLKKRFCQC